MARPPTRESGRSKRPRSVAERARSDAAGIAALLVLGAGFVALFSGVELFFLVWILGFTVVVPLVAILFEKENGDEPFSEDLYRGTERFVEFAARTAGTVGAGTDRSRRQGSDGPDSVPRTDALATLRERYARGDLTDEQFERKLDALLRTDTPENAADWRRETREREAEREPE